MNLLIALPECRMLILLLQKRLLARLLHPQLPHPAWRPSTAVHSGPKELSHTEVSRNRHFDIYWTVALSRVVDDTS